MNLPDQQVLEDAEWQLAFATQQLSPFLATLQAKTATPPADPARRAAYDQTCAMLRALSGFFTANEALLKLLKEREDEMNGEMAAANFRYRQMMMERDFALREAQAQSPAHHEVLALLTSLAPNQH